MAAFIMLDQTNSEGILLRKTLINLDAVIRIDTSGSNHCSRLLRSFTIGQYESALSDLHLSSSHLFVAGSLQDLQVKLNVAGEN